MYLCCLVPLHDIFSYFYGTIILVLKVPLNPKQTNKQIPTALPQVSFVFAFVSNSKLIFGKAVDKKRLLYGQLR